MRKIVSNIYKIYELHVVKKLDAAIVCYHWTEERYSKIINNVKLIFNFPIVNETIKSCYNSENRSISYAGGISKQWCHEDLIKSLKLCNSKIKYTLAGDINDSYGKQLQESDGWERVDFLGRISHERVYESVYGKAFAGVALLDYISQCKGKIGNLSNTKIFEIMMAGLPLICTDFQLWKNIIEEEQCGICVNPHDSKQISEAIDFVFKSSESQANGRKRKKSGD